MKKYRVEYENYSILFGDNRFSVEVEAENEQSAIGKVMLMKSQYAIGNFKVSEIHDVAKVIKGLSIIIENTSRCETGDDVEPIATCVMLRPEDVDAYIQDAVQMLLTLTGGRTA